MISKELLEYYESLINDLGPEHQEVGRHLRAYITGMHDLWEKRVILRELRYRAGTPVCSGEVDCLENPTCRCIRGEHPTCPRHTDCCYLCNPKPVLAREPTG